MYFGIDYDQDYDYDYFYNHDHGYDALMIMIILYRIVRVLWTVRSWYSPIQGKDLILRVRSKDFVNSGIL